MTKILKIFFPIIIFAFIILLLISPAKYCAVALDGALVWATILLPSLFPFMFFSRLFSTFDVSNKLAKPFSKITSKFYNCSHECAYVFVLSLLCGYPIGAKLTADLCLDGKISRGEAMRCVSFVSNCGPMFLIGSVGAGMLGSTKAGLILLACHIFGSLINGFIYRKCWLNQNEKMKRRDQDVASNNLSDIVFSSINSVLMVGAYVMIFFIVAEIFSSLKLFAPVSFLLSKLGVSCELTEGFLSGLLEITKGAKAISMAETNLKVAVPLICFISTFGGFSTFMQCHTFLEKIGMKKSVLFLQKTTQALIATALCVVVSMFAF